MKRPDTVRITTTIPRKVSDRITHLARIDSTSTSSLARRLLTDAVLGRNRSRVPDAVKPISLHLYEFFPYDEVVYLLLHRGEVVFVSRTSTLSTRVRAHRADKEFDSIFFVKEFPEGRTATDVEQAFIAQYKPRYNAPLTHEVDPALLIELGFWEHQAWAADSP